MEAQTHSTFKRYTDMERDWLQSQKMIPKKEWEHKKDNYNAGWE